MGHIFWDAQADLHQIDDVFGLMLISPLVKEISCVEHIQQVFNLLSK